MIDSEIIQWAWENAQIVNGVDSNLIRKDACGAWIVKDKYGDRSNPFGWEVDHIYPISRGGDDYKGNLRALQHENNVSKGASYPTYIASVTSAGNSNVKHMVVRTINRKMQAALQEHYKY